MLNKKPHTIKNPETRRPTNKNSFAYRLSYALKARKLLAKDICQATKIGKSTMSLYVNGKSVPSRERIIILSDALNVNLDWLLGKSELNSFTKYNDKPDDQLKQIMNIWQGLNRHGRERILDYSNIIFISGQFKR